MVKLNEVVEKKPLFEGTEKTSKEDKEKLAKESKEIKVFGFAKLSSQDGDYGVCQYNAGDGVRSMTINTMQLEVLEEALDKVGLNEVQSTKTEKYFEEAIECTFKLVEAKNSNKSYYIFE